MKNHLIVCFFTMLMENVVANDLLSTWSVLMTLYGWRKPLCWHDSWEEVEESLEGSLMLVLD